jgi:hypothetical protein
MPSARVSSNTLSLHHNFLALQLVESSERHLQSPYRGAKANNRIERSINWLDCSSLHSEMNATSVKSRKERSQLRDLYRTTL